MNTQEKRQAERLNSMDKLFKALRHKKAQLKLINKTYVEYKQELINIQANMVKMNNLIK